jgi:glycosyltransferase involved in cell wall biosynthesis
VRVLMVALSTYTSKHHRSRLRFLGDQVTALHVLAGDVPTLWGKGDPAPDDANYSLRLLQPLSTRSTLFMALRGLQSAAAETRPDIIHVEAEPWQFVAMQSVVAAHGLGVPVGVLFAENGPALHGVVGAARRFAARRVLRHCDYAVGWAAGSTAVAERLGRPGLLTDTIPGTGIDMLAISQSPGSSDSQRWFGNPGDCGRVAFVGRLEPEKGVHDALAAFDRLSERLCVRVAMAGAGSLEDELRSWVQSRPWARFHGLLDRPGVTSLFACADVALFPSRTVPTWSEQFGKGAIEAMAVGTPVVAYGSGSLPEVVQDAGMIVPEGDVEALAEAALELLRDDSPARLRALARDRACAFGEEILAYRLASLWKRVLDKS